LFGYVRSAIEALLGIEPTLLPLRHVLRDDDLVVIGTPIWFWNVASPVRSFLLAHRAGLGRVAFFCTCGGSGQDKVFGDLHVLCGRAPVATLALTERQCAPGAHEAELSDFVRALNKGRPSAHVPHAARPAAGRAHSAALRRRNRSGPEPDKMNRLPGDVLGAATHLKGTP